MTMPFLDLQRELDEALRNDFVAFVERCFRHLNPGQDLVPTWYIRTMAFYLWAIAVRRQYNRLVINLPPRALKSTMVSVALPAFLLGRDPTRRVVVCCYSQELSNTFGRQTRDIMQSDWYRRLFPSTRLSPKRTAEHDFHTTCGGFRMATSTGGTLTGRGGDTIIVDDPLKAEDAYSEAIRNRCNEWIKRTLFHRRDNKKIAVMIVAQQRLHEDDLSGQLLRTGDWQPLVLPAIAQEDSIQTLDYHHTHFWPKGEPLDPEREDLAMHAQTERDVGSAIFAAQYLQDPTPADGEVVHVSWFRRYDEIPLGGQTVLSLDTAFKADEHNDYSCATLWQVVGDDYYLTDVWRRQVDYPTLKYVVRALIDKHRPDRVVIEDKASGQSLIQELRREGFYISDYQPKGDKETRMRVQAAKIEVGRVYLPREADWLDNFEHEVRMFPHGKHDDQVDAMAQFLDHESKPSGTIYNLKWDRGRLVIRE